MFEKYLKVIEKNINSSSNRGVLALSYPYSFPDYEIGKEDAYQFARFCYENTILITHENGWLYDKPSKYHVWGYVKKKCTPNTSLLKKRAIGKEPVFIDSFIRYMGWDEYPYKGESLNWKEYFFKDSDHKIFPVYVK